MSTVSFPINMADLSLVSMYMTDRGDGVEHRRLDPGSAAFSCEVVGIPVFYKYQTNSVRNSALHTIAIANVRWEASCDICIGTNSVEAWLRENHDYPSTKSVFRHHDVLVLQPSFYGDYQQYLDDMTAFKIVMEVGRPHKRGVIDFQIAQSRYFHETI